jgi:hypothetical protein
MQLANNKYRQQTIFKNVQMSLTLFLVIVMNLSPIKLHAVSASVI